MSDWPPVKLMRAPKSHRLRFAPPRPAPGCEGATETLSETYVPLADARKVEAELAQAFSSLDIVAKQRDAAIRLDEGFEERLLEKALDEPAISAAESAYKAMLPAANDPWDDTGWAEPMTEAVQAAIRHAAASEIPRLPVARTARDTVSLPVGTRIAAPSKEKR